MGPPFNPDAGNQSSVTDDARVGSSFADIPVSKRLQISANLIENWLRSACH
jgi:hypothetical protein